jgi:outer membrane protein TolC
MLRTTKTLFRLSLSLLLAITLGSAASAQTAQPEINTGQMNEGSSADATAAEISGQSPFLGSVPTGKPTGTVIPLSINDAIEQGLKYNLGLIESDVGTRTSRAERLRALSRLLPNINASFSQEVQQIDLQAMGINFPGVPKVVGPFGVQDARGYLSQQVFDWSAVENLRASGQSQKASQYTYQNSRDIVVLAVGNAYLQVIADAASVESQQAQVNTSQALYQQAVDRRVAGLAAQIDETRAKVETQTEQQRLIATQNQLAKDKLAMARIIGLPLGQQFTLTDTVPYAPLEGVTVEGALQEAYAHRADLLSAEAALRSAELSRKAAVAERYPTLSTDTNYGDIGPNLASSHGTVTFAATLNIPIFQGGRIKADILQADAELQKRQAELANMRGQIDNEVRSALLDLNSARDLVSVSKSNLSLADETLAQAKDRFAAGVTDNLEVVQAQESVATANQAYISSLYSFNIAKVELAKAAGVAERAVKDYLGGQ